MVQRILVAHLLLVVICLTSNAYRHELGKQFVWADVHNPKTAAQCSMSHALLINDC